MQTEIIAWVGVAIGAFSLGWHVYVHLSNRGKLKVNAFIYTHEDGTKQRKSLHIKCTVTNFGRQAAFVVSAGVDYQRMTMSWEGGASGLPARLAPGEWRTVEFDYQGFNFGQAKDVWARDSLGKIYRINRKERKTLVAQAREIEQERESSNKSIAAS